VIDESETITVRWEGAQFSRHSLGHVNRELCLGLLASERVELSLVPTEPAHFAPDEDPRFAALQERFFAPLSKPAQVHVRHFFPPRFEPPAEGRLVLMQPWEYGFLPNDWIAPIQNDVAEVWCYSEYVRRVYLDSGIPASKLHVVPLGVDTEVFHPNAPPYIFTDEAGASRLASVRGREYSASGQGRFTFLFAGGTLHRKGIDILLEAYRQAFTTLDEVCLVVKDTGTSTVYRGQNERERILQLAGDASLPPIVYLEDDLSAHQLAGLYVAADCLVQPYRGEGFCLPALEAMACGVPVIVPQGGPTDDFVDEAVGWRIAAEKKPRENQRIGEWECAGPTWMFEIDPGELAHLMRAIYGNREEAARRGQAAVQKVRGHWTWRQASAAVLARLQALGAPAEETAKNTKVISAESKAKVGQSAAANATKPAQNVGAEQNAGAKRTPSPSDLDASSPASAPRALPTISLCMIVRDEERVLAACLQSVRPFVDEIIVVDTGSTDRTVAIAQEHGARVFHFAWCDDFSAARNQSLRHATGEWIFWMDADDTIPADCGAKLRELAELAEERTTGFLMQVHIPPAPGEDGFTIVDHVKLFRNLPELRFEGRIHEQILEPIHRSGGRVERSDLHVVHSGYDYSPAGQQKKRERDLLLLQKDLDERPGHPFVLFNIGMTAHHLKDWDKAIAALQECLQKTRPRESIVRKAHAMLAGCYLAKGEVAQAVSQIEKGLALFPHDPELLFRAGIIYREAGNLATAERAYVTLLANREVGHIDSLDVTMTGFKAHHNLALIYRDMGRLHEAEARFRAALTDNPEFLPSRLGLNEVLQRIAHG
jgi:glycosyltransferase involved in cell wall biosynthesis/tetratricopeptide (TPR) repeat protein